MEVGDGGGGGGGGGGGACPGVVLLGYVVTDRPFHYLGLEK